MIFREGGDDGTWGCIDNNSTNGTYINRRRLEAHKWEALCADDVHCWVSIPGLRVRPARAR